MRKTFVVLGAMLMVSAVLPTVAAHWDWVNDGIDCNNVDWDDTDPIPPGADARTGQVNTCGIAGRVVGAAGPLYVTTSGTPGQGPYPGGNYHGVFACDLEVGDVTGSLGEPTSSAANEVEIDETHQPDGEAPDNTWDDGGYGAACHKSEYAESDWNTEGCGETEDHGFARATAPTALPVFILTGCDIGTWSSNEYPVAALVGAPRCTVDQVRSGTPGTWPKCVSSLTDPAPSGFSSCQNDGVYLGHAGYATSANGPSVPTKTEVQSKLGGSLDCSDTPGQAAVYVMEAVDFGVRVSGPATYVWTTGQR